MRVRIVASDGGAALGSSLARVGFPVLQPVEAVGIKGSGGARAGASDGSEIRFAPADRYRAELLQRWLAGPVSLVEDDGEPTGVVQLHQHGPLIVRAAAEASTPRWTIAARASDGFLPAVDAANC